MCAAMGGRLLSGYETKETEKQEAENDRTPLALLLQSLPPENQPAGGYRKNRSAPTIGIKPKCIVWLDIFLQTSLVFQKLLIRILLLTLYIFY